MVTQEQHDMFANGLALLVPNPTWHALASGVNITPDVLKAARSGAYSACDFKTERGVPYAFNGAEYWRDLIPAIEALWRACYSPR